MSTTIESLELEILSNSTNAAQGIDALTLSLERLGKATKGLGLSGVAKDTGKLSNAMNKVSNANAKTSASFTDLYHKVKTATSGIKAIGEAIFSSIKKSSSYTETMNLFTVSMGEYAYKAKQYTDIVSETMGIDPAEWMQFQGTIMTLATGFGIAGDRASVMSKQLTQLAYDISSFREMSVGDAMLKVQSGFAGELEPLRAIGYDLSQARLAAIALELGIDKSVSSMTQAEKAQLRYYAIMTQVTSAQGDMARTLESPSNQMRVFKAQVNMAAREIGNIFIPALNAILPYAIAVTKVIRSLAGIIAGLFGHEMPDMSESTSKVVENTDAMKENLEKSQEEAKKLKSYMLGFDELNVINPNEGKSSETDDPLGGFDFKLPEYDFMSGLVESKVATIVKEMKEWLGLTDDIDSWSELFDTRLGHILEVVGLIGAGILAWKVTKTFMDSITALKLLLSNPTYAIAISVILTITGIVISFNGMEDAVKNGLDGFNFAEIVGGGLLGAGGAAVLGSKIATWISTAFASSTVDLALTQAGINLGVGTVGAAGAALAAGVTGIILGIPMYFVGIYDAINEGIDWLSALLIPLGSTAAGAGTGVIISAITGAVAGPIGALIGLAIGLITDFTIWFWQKFDEIEAWFNTLPGWGKALVVVISGLLGPVFTVIMSIITVIKKWDEIVPWVKENVIQPVVNFFKGLWEKVSGFFKELWKDVSGFFSNLWEDIVGIWTNVSTWFDENVIQPVVSFFEGLTLRISQFFEGCWILIQAVWLVASTWFNETFIVPTVEFFKGLWEDISGFFTQLWADIVAIWKDVSTWFNETVVTPVVDFFEGVWTKVSGFFSSLWEDVKKVWVDVSSWFDETIVEPVKKAFKDACKAIGGFFSSLWLGIRQGVANAMNGVIGGIEFAINKVVSGINSLMDGFNKVVQWGADIIGKEWGGVTLLSTVTLPRITVPTYAEGGFPEQGQMFIAREAGAEMVGNIGRRTAVANNDQIVSGIAGGVAEANEEQNVLLREQNSLLRAILEKDNGVYLDGKNLTHSVEKYQRERGRVLITGGVV